MGGADLAARLIRAPSEHNTSFREVELAAEEEEDNDEEDEERWNAGKVYYDGSRGGGGEGGDWQQRAGQLHAQASAMTAN